MNLLRSHLFWFVVIGASIFAIDALRPDSERIVVDESVAVRLAGMWQGQMGRAPTAEELHHLLQNWVEEEMLYREAMALGLDDADEIVRRRLVQKINFIAEQDASDEPSREAVRAWFELNSDQYRLPERLSFEQLRVPDDREAAALLAEVEAANDWRRLGAPAMQNPAYVLLSEREIGAIFGRDFARELISIDAYARWYGPVESKFGQHLVRVTERRPPGVPPFDAVESRVVADFVQVRRDQARAAYLMGLEQKYDVTWRIGD